MQTCVHPDMLVFSNRFSADILSSSPFTTCGGQQQQPTLPDGSDGAGAGERTAVWQSLELRGSARTNQMMAVFHVRTVSSICPDFCLSGS